MLDVLDKLRAENTLCEIYADPEDMSGFEMGYVIAVTPKHYLLECVGSTGEHGGFLVGFTEDVFKVCTDTPYTIRAEKLMLSARFIPKISPYQGGDILEEMLYYAYSGHILVRFTVAGRQNADDGFIEEIGGRTVTFSLVDSFGAACGKCIVLTEDIELFMTDGPWTRKIQTLVSANKT